MGFKESNQANKQNQREKYIFVLEIITCDPSVYTMDHPELAVSNFMGNSISIQWVEVFNNNEENWPLSINLSLHSTVLTIYSA